MKDTEAWGICIDDGTFTGTKQEETPARKAVQLLNRFADETYAVKPVVIVSRERYAALTGNWDERFAGLGRDELVEVRAALMRAFKEREEQGG